ncbi:hypothetical protein BHE74_00045265 [Ensete ventricosum]|nr:hypothetical protein BHE74_00045265 [Ensete ventricosum]
MRTMTGCCLRDSSTFIVCGSYDWLECESCNRPTMRVVLRVLLLRFKVLFFRFFNRFYHGKLPFFAAMVAAPKFVAMPTKALRRSITKLFSRLSDLHELFFDIFVLGRSKAIQQSAFELYPRRDSLGVFKPIVPSNCISFEVDDSGVYHGSLRCPVITKVAFRARKPSCRRAAVAAHPAATAYYCSPAAAIVESSILLLSCYSNCRERAPPFTREGA